MTVQQAAGRWRSRQARLLAATYRQGWEAGVRNYRSQHATPPAAKTATGLPVRPNTQTMQRALGPAVASLARMGAQIAALVPTAAQIAAAGTVGGAVLLAVKQYLKTNGWLLAAGVSVAWAGEQAGYAEAAAADGLLLEWQLDPRAEHCDTCPKLALLPPLPLDLWPTLPGEGATECNVGCRCCMRAVPGAKPASLTAAQHELLSMVGNRQPVLVAA